MAKAGIQINIVGSLNAKALRDAQTELGKLSQAADRSSRTFGDRVRAMGDSMVSAGRRISRVGTDLATKVTLPIVGIGAVAVNSAAQFEQTMNTMAAVAGVPAAGIEKLSQLALKMGAETQYSAGQAAEAMLELAKGGLTEAQIQAGGLRSTLTLAAAGGLDLGSAATYMSDALNAFGVDASESGRVAASLAGAANASTASVESLGLGLSMAGMASKHAGLSIEEATAALGLLETAGIHGSDAGTALKTMLLNLVPTTDKAAETMDALGVNFTHADGSFKALAEVAQILQDKLGGLSEAEQTAALKAIFGTDAFRSAKVMMEAGAAGVRKYTAATSDLDAAQRVADARMQGLSGSLERAKGSLETAGLVLGEALTPHVEAAAGFVERLANSFAGLDSRTQRVILVAGGMAAALGPVLFVVGKVTTGVGHLTRGVTKGAKAAAAIGRGARTAAQGAGRLIAGFRDARVAASQFSGRLGTVGGKLRTMVDGTGRAARKLADLGKAALSAGRKVAAQFARMAAKAAASTVKVVAQLAIQGAKWAWMGVQALAHAAKVAAAWVIAMGPIAIVVAAVVAAVALIVKNWDWVKEKVVAAAKAVWEFIKSAFEKIKTFITETLPKIAKWIIDHHPLVVLFRLAKEKLPSVLTWFGELPGKIVSKIASLGSRLATSVGGAMSTMKTKAVEWGGRILTWYVELPGKIAGKLGSLGGKLAGKAGEAMSAMWGKVSEWGGRIVGWFAGLGDAAKEALGSLGEKIVEALKAAWTWLAKKWNDLIAGKGFSIPDIPGLPGRGERVEVPRLPEFHAGGVVPGRPGEEVLALLEAGEHVISRRDAQGLRDGGRVVPIDAQRRSEPDRQTSYTFHVYEAQSPAAAADAIVWKLKVSGF